MSGKVRQRQYCSRFRSHSRRLCRAIISLSFLFGSALAYEPAWIRLYDGPSRNQYNRAADICAGPSGTILVCGCGEQWVWPWNSDMLMARISEQGDTLWVRQLGGNWGIPDMAHALVLAPEDGSAYCVGVTENVGPRWQDISWLKVDSTGQVPPGWVNCKTFWPGQDAAYDMVMGRHGDLYCCGADRRNTLQPDISAFTLIRINPSDGSIIWSRSLRLDKDPRRAAVRDLHPGFYRDWFSWENCATSMAVADDGNIVVAGFGLNGLTERDVWVMRFDTAGNRLWSTTYLNGGAYDDVAFDLAVARDRSIYVAGLTESEANLYDFLVLRVADTGGILAAYTYNGMPEGDDFAAQLVLDEAEPQNLYVTGTSEHPLRGSQVMTQKFDSNLVPLWGPDGAKLGWSGDDFGYDIACSNRRVYVVGAVSDDILVACYSDSNVPGGETLWMYSYDSPGHRRDFAAAIAIVDTGHIYVSGECQRVGQWDWSSLFTARFDLVGATEEPGSRNRPFRLDFSPNPCHGIGRLPLPEGSRGNIRLRDLGGRQVMAVLPVPDAGGIVTLDLRHLAPVSTG